jgi:LysM repeat protein
MMKNHFGSFCIKLLTMASVSTTAWPYVVKNGDTLSEIAYKNISANVYGKNGSMVKILNINPQIKNPNLIMPGQVINLDKSETPKLTEIPTERNVATDSLISTQNFVENNNSEMASKVSPLLKRRATVALNPFYNIANLSSADNVTGSESTIASKYYAGVNASYVQEWNKDFQTAINFKLASIAFEGPANSTKTLQDKSKFLSTIGVETNHNIGKKTHLKLGLSYGKELFIRAASTQSVAVDAINVPSISSKISYDIIELSPFALGVSATYSAKMPAKADSYNIKLGHEYGANIYLNQFTGNSHNSKIQTELGFTRRSQNTNITSQTETNIMLGVRFHFSTVKGSSF